MKELITTEVELKRTAPSFLDGRWVRKETQFDSAAGMFEMKCWTPADSDKQLRRVREWKASRFRFNNVIECDIHITEEVAYYEISQITYSAAEKAITIDTHYAATIRLRVDRLDLEIEGLNESRQDWT